MTPAPRPQQDRLARALMRWLRAYADAVLLGHRVMKQQGPSAREKHLEEELRKILLTFGLYAARDGVLGAARSVGGRVLVPESLIADAIAGKPMRITWIEELRGQAERRARDISEETRRRVTESVRTLLAEAQRETPVPSTGEIARRIRSQVHSRDEDAERAFGFSAARAEVIARTELVQAENSGIFEGYTQLGIEEIEWLAYSDGRSGERHHEAMDGKRTRVGDPFVTPLGHKMRYPGDPLAPIAETANCRCSHKAVLRPKEVRRGR